MAIIVDALDDEIISSFLIKFVVDGGGGVGEDVCDCNRTAGGVADAFDKDVSVGEASDGSIFIISTGGVSCILLGRLENDLDFVSSVTTTVVGIGVDASLTCVFGV